MAAAFLGLPVACTLHNGSIIEGIVANIDPNIGSLSVKNATITKDGNVSHESLMVLPRSSVAGLKLLSVQKRNDAAHTTEPSTTTPTNSGSSLEYHQQQPQLQQQQQKPQSQPQQLQQPLQVPLPQKPSKDKESPSSISAKDISSSSTPRIGTTSQHQQQQQPFKSPVNPSMKPQPQFQILQRPSPVNHHHFNPDLGSGSEMEEIPAVAKVLPPRRQKVKKVVSVSTTKLHQDADRPTCKLSKMFSQANRDSEKASLLARQRQVSTNATTDPTVQSNIPQPIFEEFDFDAGLRSFDKARVFQEIKSEDTIDPSLRLHAHNKNNRGQLKLAPNESVLSEAEVYAQQQESESLQSGPAETTTDDEPSEFEQPKPVPPPAAATRRPHKERRSTLKPGNTAASSQYANGFITASGIKAVNITLRQYKEVVSIADIETGPTADQRSENGGRGIATFILRVLCSERMDFPLITRKRPYICILCGDGRKGALALRGGVHLSNHGASVVAFVPSYVDLTERLRTNLRVFSSAGGRIVRQIEDLDKTYDLLIDAIADSEAQSTQDGRSQDEMAVVSWALESGSPVLSIDSPHGVDHDSGMPTVTSPLRPHFIACCGAVRSGCRKTHAEVVLIDVGLSPSLWQRAGVEGWDPKTFGADFVVSLQGF